MLQSPAARLALLGLLALLACALFLTLGARGSWSFVLAYRGQKLATLVIVAVAIAVSSVLFQTVSENRILTPALMGFDALYALLQTALVFTLGSAAVGAIEPRLLFLGEVGAMMGFSLLLYRGLFSGAVRSLHLLMLVGIVSGILFRSLSGLMQRLIDPNEFVVLQDRLFASFNTVPGDLLLVAAILVAASLVPVARNLAAFDVLTLGRSAAIGLGVDHRASVRMVLPLVAVLVSVSTALVGPVTFFGLLVASLAYRLTPSHRHVHILPAAALVAILCLVAGQTLLERVFAFDTALGIIVEFAGGLVFLVLLLRGAAR
ncbi:MULTISPECIES: iron chelate uptake ABC transporter family permease subunit [unclassified Aureimonas]|uniref:iron chelate uptake ABC transporter family permease subunit n=1 Tax=unclassified Aureimonas TaxID=2615206 RepID=UPI0006F6BAB6|nr:MULTISPECIES: iron chelate uptake ABC transporter family permease subunit [unclassified Aureimonas]KQT60754.1 enterobactin ABC transporter permease [Aureimonas sp. Leaf460]KQT68884.1 enterobactin ABC transporter permease [Aureimonas sp. Leaf427]